MISGQWNPYTDRKGETVTTLLARLQRHDWFWGYSDDHRWWKKGRKEDTSLRASLSQCKCPYGMSDIRCAVLNMIEEDFKKEEDGYWYRQPHVYKNVAGVNKSDLISRSYAQEIISWLENAGM
jgi:hypothetical protein